MVTIAGGEKFEGKICCPNIKISLTVVDTKANLLVIPLGDSQVILDIIWLQGL